MGTSLINTKPKNTYTGLIKTTDSTPLSTTLKSISDGAGNDSALELATDKVKLTNPEFTNGTYNVSSTELGYLDGVTSAIQTQINAKQGSLTLTTTGSSGAATLVGSTLNIPQYSGGSSGVSQIVAGTNVTISPAGGTGVVTINATGGGGGGSGTVTNVSALTLGTTGTDLSSTVANSTTTPVITLNVPTASASNRGALSSTDWSTFNGKQDAITGAATTIVSSNLTASRATVSDGSGKISASTTTVTELGYVGGVTSAIQTQLDSKTSKILTANRQTASYTLVSGDADKLVEMNVASANNLTVPASVFSAGQQILLAQYGAGQTTIVAGAGMTIRSNGGKLNLSAQYSGATLVFLSSSEAYLFGDISI